MSLEIQSAAAARFCEECGWDLVDVFVDAGERGGKWERPELQRLLSHFPSDRRRHRAAAPFDVVLTYKLDRIARSSIDTHEIIGRLERAGVGFRSIAEPAIDTTTPIGRLFLSLLAAIAEMEKAHLSARITPAMQAKTDRGEWVGRAPIGYRVKDKRLVFDETMTREGISVAELTRQVFHAYGREGVGIHDLSARISAALGGGRNRTSRGFGTSQVSRMLRRRSYLGEIDWNGAVYPGAHEPLIALDLWEAVQTRLQHTPKRRHHPESCYLFAGILRCRLCGGPMVGHTSRRRRDGKRGDYVYRRYECNHDRTSAHRRAAAIRLDLAHALIFRALHAHLQGNQNILPLTLSPSVPGDPTQGLRRRLDTIGEQLDRLVDQLSRGVLGEEEFGRARLRLSSEREELESALANPPPAPVSDPRQVRKLLRSTLDIIEDPEVVDDLKREAAAVLLDRISIEREGENGLVPHIIFRQLP